MNKKTCMIITILIIFLVGCEQTKKYDQPPPFSPPPPGAGIGPIGRAAPLEFAEPKDIWYDEIIVEPIPEIKIQSPLQKTVPKLTIIAVEKDGWIWNEAYLYDAKENNWVPFTFDQQSYDGWVKESAGTRIINIPLNTLNTNIPYGNAVIIFSCKQYGGKWRCGCTSTTEQPPCMRWMIRTFTVTSTAPATNITTPAPIANASLNSTQTPTTTPSTTITPTPTINPISIPTQTTTPTPSPTPSPTPTATPTATPSPTPTATPIPTQASKIVNIEIKDFKFTQKTIEINRGDAIKWTNKDTAPHTATSTSTPAKFDSGTLKQGQTFQQTFTQPGTYEYICEIHPSMTATITVK